MFFPILILMVVLTPPQEFSEGRFLHDTQDKGVSRNNPTQQENHPQVLRTRKSPNWLVDIGIPDEILFSEEAFTCYKNLLLNPRPQAVDLNEFAECILAIVPENYFTGMDHGPGNLVENMNGNPRSSKYWDTWATRTKRDPGMDDLSVDNNLKVLDRFYTKNKSKENLLNLG